VSPLVLSCIIFALVLAGILLGILLRRLVPDHHLSKESQDVVRLGVGLIATIAALVLGLLIAAAKSSFDTQSGQIKQFTADLILLDDLLGQYGPETTPIRARMRSAVAPLADRIWREKSASTKGTFADQRQVGGASAGDSSALAAQRRAAVAPGPRSAGQHQSSSDAAAAVCGIG
jgi:hypothetical protein